MRAEDGVIAPEERMGEMHAVPRVTLRDIDATSVTIVHEDGHGATGRHGQSNC